MSIRPPAPALALAAFAAAAAAQEPARLPAEPSPFAPGVAAEAGAEEPVFAPEAIAVLPDDPLAPPIPETEPLPAPVGIDPPAVAYAAVPATRPEAGPVTYEIFFRTDFTTLDAVAIEKIGIIADAAIAGGVGVAVIVGAADTVGAAEYNEALAARRAETVRENLIAHGVPPEVIRSEALGEALLAVPTPDEVSEIANRRVLVTLDAFGVVEPWEIDRPFAFELPPLLTP